VLHGDDYFCQMSGMKDVVVTHGDVGFIQHLPR